MQRKKDGRLQEQMLVSYQSWDHSSEQGVHRELGGTDASQSVEKGAQESPGRSSRGDTERGREGLGLGGWKFEHAKRQHRKGYI